MFVTKLTSREIQLLFSFSHAMKNEFYSLEKNPTSTDEYFSNSSLSRIFFIIIFAC